MASEYSDLDIAFHSTTDQVAADDAENEMRKIESALRQSGFELTADPPGTYHYVLVAVQPHPRAGTRGVRAHSRSALERYRDAGGTD